MAPSCAYKRPELPLQPDAAMMTSICCGPSVFSLLQAIWPACMVEYLCGGRREVRIDADKASQALFQT